MKAISIVLVLIFGIIAFTIAQEADSIVVTYNNQRTIIPVPAFGKQTAIKMADSVQLIEIGVSRRKLSDIVQPDRYPSNAVTAEKPLKKTKWFSQVEAGFIIGFVGKNRFPLFSISSVPHVYHVNNDPLPGFSLGLSIIDRERKLKNKLSSNIGLKFGFVNQYRIKKPKTEIPYDTIYQVQNFYFDYDPYTITSLQLLMPIGMCYSFGSGKAISKISFGANMGILFNFLHYKPYENNWESRYSFSMSPTVQTYVAYEYMNIGIKGLVEFTSLQNLIPLSEIRYKVGMSLTYRFY